MSAVAPAPSDRGIRSSGAGLETAPLRDPRDLHHAVMNQKT